MNCLRRTRGLTRQFKSGSITLRLLECAMSKAELASSPAVFKPKKSVALSGTPAGNTAICTVGYSGNDLHYRGYDIADLAAHCEYEEVAHLLVQGRLPDAQELAAYKQRLVGLRWLPPE